MRRQITREQLTDQEREHLFGVLFPRLRELKAVARQRLAARRAS